MSDMLDMMALPAQTPAEPATEARRTVLTRETVMRPYTIADVATLTDLVEATLPELPNYRGIRVHRERVQYLLNNNVANTAHFMCIVACDSVTHKIVGGVAGYCGPTTFSFDTIATDVYLYVAPEYRTLRVVLGLIKAYIKWAKARGASIIQATHTGGVKEHAMEALLKREGFDPVGKLYHLREGK